MEEELTFEQLMAQNTALQAEIELLKAEHKKASESSTTPYDDAWRTLTTHAPRLLVPMVNEVFGEHFSEDAVVAMKQNEHLFFGTDGSTAKRITDSSFSILNEDTMDGLLGDGFDIIEGERKKHYVFECESKPVSPAILVRIVEYAVKTGLETASGSRAKMSIYIPRTAILSLRSASSTPSEMELEIVMESGSASSAVRIMKLSDYSADVIFEKKLYLLIPFLLFNYEKQFEQIEGDDAQYNALMDEMRSVYERVDNLIPAEDGGFSLIDVFTSKALRAMTHAVVNRLAEKYPNIKEGVNAVVGGNIIEFEALKIKREGIREGIREGKREGILEGLRDGLEQGEKNGEANAYRMMAERMIQDNMPGDKISLFTNLGRHDIDVIARSLNHTVNWAGA